jgi:hypothetical protein
MNEKELSRFYYLKKEIAYIENKLKELNYGISSIKYTDDVKGSNNHTSIPEKVVELKDRWETKVILAYSVCLEIENYIESIPEAEIRLIARYRYIDCLTWDKIAAKLGKGQDRTAISKKLRKYLDNSHISHS